ncbi:hypothetical protein L1887_02307 [Cichorium endivia]|nr:hypothetical protein L1887_02307 [Cichorium endivia]
MHAWLLCLSVLKPLHAISLKVVCDVFVLRIVHNISVLKVVQGVFVLTIVHDISLLKVVHEVSVLRAVHDISMLKVVYKVSVMRVSVSFLQRETTHIADSGITLLRDKHNIARVLNCHTVTRDDFENLWLGHELSKLGLVSLGTSTCNQCITPRLRIAGFEPDNGKKQVTETINVTDEEATEIGEAVGVAVKINSAHASVKRLEA